MYLHNQQISIQPFPRLLAVAAIAFGVLIPITDSNAQFHDPGLQYAKIRTDYNAINEGTAANPITLVSPCLYPSGPGVEPCWTSPTVYQQSNYFQQNGGGSSPTFWVLSMNNEPWNGIVPNGPYNPGPPDQSLPRVFPGSGIMGFAAIVDYPAGENFWRLHEVLNHAFTNPINQGAIPYMSVGAADNRGNGGAIGSFNILDGRRTVSFTDKLWDYNQGIDPTGWVLSHFLMATAEWSGKQRMLFIHLFYDGMVDFDHDGNLEPWNGYSDIDDMGSGSTGVYRGWNWQMQESFWFPGAEVAYMDGAAMSLPQVCNMNIPQFQFIGQQIHYVIDLERAFRCASDEGLFHPAMPTSAPVYLTGVHWGVELVGDAAAVWTSVHNMRMLDPCGALLCLRGTSMGSRPPAAVLSNDSNANYGLEQHGTVPAIHMNIKASCEAVPGCAKANAWTIPGAPIQARSPDGVSGTVKDMADFIRRASSAGE